MSYKAQKSMVQPINLIYQYFKNQNKLQIWLCEQTDIRLEGRLIGFDEYMNFVLDDAIEISLKKSTRKPIGRLLIKGDNISLIADTGGK
ncbi:small nuclear ribonucleoprotein E [Schistocerca gregaria]|uniref:small nuclear ribonucleoprotein E n=1 Tax=Schistocerca gregaria TaxID=7010 RepID=UPI00211DB71E|nr:small nuclear ribonucleoprotein E [Schistocerca gregaria]